MKNSKFHSLFKEAYGRFTQGAGFLAGDVVKLKSGYENMDSFKSLGENVKARIMDMVKAGNNIRISKLHNYTAPSRYSAEGAGNLPADLADCFEESAPGYWHNLVTIPVDCLESIDTEGNLPPVPEDQKDTKDRVTGPEEVEKHKMNKGRDIDAQTKLMKKQTKAEKGDYELAEKNTKLAHSNKYNDDLPPKVKGLAKAKELKESALQLTENALDSLYIKILNEDVGAEGQSANGSMDGGDQLAGNPQMQTEDLYEFEKMALAGAKPGMSEKEVLSLAFTNIEKWAMATRKVDAGKAEIIAGNILYYTDDGDGASEVVTYYSHMFPKAAASVEDEGNEFTGDLAHTQKGDKFKIGGKTVTNTTGQIAEEVCPICGMDVCQCKKEAVKEGINTKGPKAYLPGGDPKDPSTEIKPSKYSHHGG